MKKLWRVLSLIKTKKTILFGVLGIMVLIVVLALIFPNSTKRFASNLGLSSLASTNEECVAQGFAGVDNTGNGTCIPFIICPGSSDLCNGITPGDGTDPGDGEDPGGPEG